MLYTILFTLLHHIHTLHYTHFILYTHYILHHILTLTIYYTPYTPPYTTSHTYTHYTLYYTPPTYIRLYRRRRTYLRRLWPKRSAVRLTLLPLHMHLWKVSMCILCMYVYVCVCGYIRMLMCIGCWFIVYFDVFVNAALLSINISCLICYNIYSLYHIRTYIKVFLRRMWIRG